MSDHPQGDGWWIASDGKYYPPASAQMPPPLPTSGTAPTPVKRPWWQHPALIIGSLVLCLPVGLALLWVSPWKTGVKAGLTALVLVLVGVGITTSPDEATELAAADSSETTTTVERSTSTASSTTIESTTTVPPATTAAPTTAAPTTAAPTTAPPPPSTAPAESISQSNARRKAADYLDYSAFSRQGLIDQLIYEGFSEPDAVHGVDALNPDWNEQAAAKAADYLDFSAFSRQGLIDQLIYEGFTPEQADHGVSTTGL